MSDKILFVDDESNILSTLKRQFRNIEYELLFANSGKEGLEVLKNEEISVIISDMKMPEMDGARFLEQARLIQPDSVTIILSGHAEIDTVLDSINRGNIWRFVTKPWDKDELKIAIDNAVELYQSRIREKELILSLKQKTVELDELNKSLDKKVKERTWLINERSEILNMLLEEPDTDIIIERVCRTLSSIVKRDVIITINGDLFSNNSDIPGNSFQTKEDYITHYINKDGKELGQLIIAGSYDKSNDSVKSIISIAKLVLHYKTTIDSTPDILSIINEYMDNL